MIHRLLAKSANGYWTLCFHRSHRLRLPCYRFQTSDGRCAKHDEYFHQCPPGRQEDR